MAALAPVSTTELLDLVRKSNLLPPARLPALPGPDALPADPQKAAAALVRQGFLTPFQSTQLLAGRHKGFRIGPYVVQDLLGRGGMGAVYLAEHLELGRKVAIKVLAPLSEDGQKLATERFLREARAAGALDHPNIVRIFDVARHGANPFLVMEYVDGETLQQAVDREGALPVAAAAEAIAQAAAGLQHAHERGFVHRDIKPSNLIRDRQGAVKILDMGLARSGSDQDKLTEQLDQGAVVGTADFISPEQAINHPHVDGRADIYSLGATLYTLLAGKPPFDGNTTQKLMQHQLKEPPPLAGVRPNLPPGLVAVVARMLAKKPADRYQCGAEVAAALAPWTGGSARVAAGLSHTDLGRSATRLNRAGHSATSLGTAAVPDADGSGIIGADGHETVELSAGKTTRARPAKAPARRRSRAVIAGLVLLLLAGAGVAGFVAAGGANRDFAGAARTAPPPAENNPPRREPIPPAGKPQPEPPPSAVEPAERVVFKLDAADLPDFAATRTGRGKPGDGVPFVAGVAFVGHKAQTESAWTCGPVADARAVGLTNRNEVMSTQIAVELEQAAAAGGAGAALEPGQPVRARVVYRTAGAARGMMYFQTPVGWKTFQMVALPSSNDAWATAEVTLTRGADPLRFLVDVYESGDGNTLYVRSVTITAGPKR